MNLESYRAEFPITAQHAFLSHAAVSTPSRRITQAVIDHLTQAQHEPFDRLRERVLGLGEQFKQRVGRLINAATPGDEIVAMQNVALGINTAANSLPLHAGDNVLVLDGDYPANMYPWLNLAHRGVLTKIVPQRNGGLDLEVLRSRIDNRTRVIALSTAMFATGFRNDIAAVGALCRERGIFFVVDAIQTLGAFPLDVQACGIDMLACGAQKWLLALPGAGFLYCRHELLDQLQPGAYVGTTSTVDPFNFLDYNFTLQPSAERFSLGTPNFVGTIALSESIHMLLAIGADVIAERIVQLTNVLVDDLQARGYRIITNLAPENRSGIIIVEMPDPQAAYERLLDANVVTAVRGAGLRIAPHFYNSTDDVLRVGAVLGNR
jgi:cysteine desulfurase / selenocysteine lyase